MYPSDLKKKRASNNRGFFWRWLFSQNLFSKQITYGFYGLKNRGIVEKTFAWLGNFRGLAKDLEIMTGTSENMVRIAMLKLTLKKC
jgi:transposase